MILICEILLRDIVRKKTWKIIICGLTHYSLVLLIYTPENIRKPNGFMMFSGGIDKQRRAVMC